MTDDTIGMTAIYVTGALMMLVVIAYSIAQFLLQWRPPRLAASLLAAPCVAVV